MNNVCRLAGRVSLLLMAWGIPLATLVSTAQAAETPPSLKQAFESAWVRQPEARAAGARRDAVGARRQTADGWLAEPPSLEISYKTDQLNRDQGSREYEAGLAMPLWLPGERAGQRALAEVEGAALERQLEAAQLRMAGEVREAWWSLAQARIDLESAESRLQNAERLAADVARRVKAGDLSRADGHQANATLAGAVAEVARSRGALAEAAKPLRTLTGGVLKDALPVDPELVPAEVFEGNAHPLLKEWSARVETARAARTLAGVQSRANPELRLAATSERADSSESYSQTITLGVRIPFGSDSRQRARVATASAEEIEAEAQLAVERERIAAGIDAARQREDAARAWLAAAEQQARLANESRGFFEKSFRLGETDLPTRLRIEGEAAEAEREAARARVELAASVSALRQALGLLPE
jgi:cobalt-zinc-cadmium efflux system outer membrane protein